MSVLLGPSIPWACQAFFSVFPSRAAETRLWACVSTRVCQTAHNVDSTNDYIFSHNKTGFATMNDYMLLMCMPFAGT